MTKGKFDLPILVVGQSAPPAPPLAMLLGKREGGYLPFLLTLPDFTGRSIILKEKEEIDIDSTYEGVARTFILM